MSFVKHGELESGGSHRDWVGPVFGHNCGLNALRDLLVWTVTRGPACEG